MPMARCYLALNRLECFVAGFEGSKQFGDADEVERLSGDAAGRYEKQRLAASRWPYECADDGGVDERGVRKVNDHRRARCLDPLECRLDEWGS
jgi:hypothetical protein